MLMRSWCLSLVLGCAVLGGCSAPPTPVEARPVVEVAPPPASATVTVTASAAASTPPPAVAPAPIVKKVEAIKLTFELPNDAWKDHPGIGKTKPGVTHIGWERDDVLDDQGGRVRPYCGVTTEPAPKERNIVTYSVSWRTRVPFHVDEVFSHEDGTIQLKNVIGYRGKVTYEGNEHTLFVLHGIFKDRGFAVVCDTTTSVLEKVRDEIASILKSMKHTEDP